MAMMARRWQTGLAAGEPLMTETMIGAPPRSPRKAPMPEKEPDRSSLAWFTSSGVMKLE
jgi:hypothetical protein